MADSTALAEVRRARAVEAVGNWLFANAGGARPLTPSELRSYQPRRLSAAWRVQVAFPDCCRDLDLLLCERFPWRAPQVALVDRSAHLAVPHVESDGVLCALPGHAEIDPDHAVEAAQHVLSAASSLIAEAVSGARDDDFREEFRSYWPTDERAPDVRTIVDPTGPTRLVHVWRGQDFYLVGETSESVLRWLDHYAGEQKAKRTTEKGVFIWLEKALLPCEYPKTAAEVLALARGRTEHGGELIQQLAAVLPEKLVTVLGAPTSNGPALAAMTITKPGAVGRGPGRRGADPLTRGFRPGKMPVVLAQVQMLGGSRVLRSGVDRADAAWIHGRGADPRQPQLAGADVTLVGCGSVGSPVATLLAQAGVGRLTLIDPELLTWANVGRHSLGAQSVRRSKARDLADKLRRDYPHITQITPKIATWEDVARDEPTLLTSPDLIISTVGSWGVEGALNEWHLGAGRSPAVLYGWTEAHACAGQAVLVDRQGGCLACGLSSFGAPRLRVTEWPRGGTQHQEPACGAVYQPYGPAELTHIVALIVDLALDAIVGRVQGSAHRLWCARRQVLDEAGGSWTPEWGKIAAGRPQGGFIEERTWTVADDCSFCRQHAS